MVAAYIGQMAPSGRIAVAALFQCGDEIRRIQRFAYRLALLARCSPDIGTAGRGLWESDPRWQPLRRAIERLLVTYDWGEAFVALNVCLKPMIDDFFLVQLAVLADRSRDHLDAQILRSLFEDSEWHVSWTEALLAHAYADRPDNRAVVAGWIDAWAPTVEAAEVAAAALLGTERRSTAAVIGRQKEGGAFG
jgi:toluene monooxygenase system protein E